MRLHQPGRPRASLKGELYADPTHSYTLLLTYLIRRCHGNPLYLISVPHVSPIQYMHFIHIVPIFRCNALQVLVQIGYSWICKPHTLPPTFVHFLNHHGGKELWFYKAAKVRLSHCLVSLRSQQCEKSSKDMRMCCCVTYNRGWRPHRTSSWLCRSCLSALGEGTHPVHWRHSKAQVCSQLQAHWPAAVAE